MPNASRQPLAAAVVPRKAATVLVVREQPDGIGVFMVQRPGRGVFPNLHVFPGGKVEGADADMAHLCVGLDDGPASRRLGLAEGGLRYWVTAIRECFEECGVLLAYRGETLFAPADDAEQQRFDGFREALAAGDLSLTALARQEDLRLATDRVYYFSHWITPPSAPARFDTRFFLAVMPHGQAAEGHWRETVAGGWTTPAQALARHADGDWQMIHPTLTTLRTAAGYGTVADLVAAVQAGSHIATVDDALHEQGMQFDSVAPLGQPLE